MTMTLEDPRKVPGGPGEEREGLQYKSPAGRKLQSAGVSLLRVSGRLYLRAQKSGSATACDLEAVSTGSGSAIAHPARSLSRPVCHSTWVLRSIYTCLRITHHTITGESPPACLADQANEGLAYQP